MSTAYSYPWTALKYYIITINIAQVNEAIEKYLAQGYKHVGDNVARTQWLVIRGPALLQWTTRAPVGPVEQ